MKGDNLLFLLNDITHIVYIESDTINKYSSITLNCVPLGIDHFTLMYHLWLKRAQLLMA